MSDAAQTLEPLPWQARALQLRTHVDLLIAVGGRSGGKSHCAALACLGHCATLLEHANPVVVREAFAPLGQFMSKLEALCAVAFGTKGLSYNRSEAKITLPTGGIIHGASLHEGESAYVRWQGVNLSGVFAEEVGAYNANHFMLMRKLESNLRPPKGFVAERFWTGNPGGPSSQLLFRNWMSKVPPWTIGRDHTGLTYVWMPSTYRENLHIDRDQYARNLTAAVGSDEALAKAWLDGRWDSIGGLRFTVNPDVHLLRPLPDWMIRRFGRPVAGSDWGSHAPATCVLAIQLTESINWDGRRLPYGSIICVEETDTAIDDHDLSAGSGLDARSFAEQVHAMLERNGALKADVLVDDAKGLKGDSVIDYYRAANIRATMASKKSRVEGWEIIQQHLAEAERDEMRPGLYFTTKCPHLFQTISEAPRGTVNPRDLDPKWNFDHWADALSYLMKEVAGGPKASQKPVVGAW